MTGKAAIIGAVVGAVVGALVWGAISAWTGYEIGFIAWGIGLAVGGLSAALGGAGTANAVLCGLLALGSIFCGKMLAVEWGAPAELRKLMAAELTPDMYAEIQKDAEDFAQVSSEEDYPAFMVTHDYTEATSADEVTPEELADFNQHAVPRLWRMHEEQPTYEQWRDAEVDRVVAMMMEEAPIAQFVVEDIGLFDVIFGLLGVVTAYRLGMGFSGVPE